MTRQNRQTRRALVQGKTPQETIEALMLHRHLRRHRAFLLLKSINSHPYALFAAGFTVHVGNTPLR